MRIQIWFAALLLASPPMQSPLAAAQPTPSKPSAKTAADGRIEGYRSARWGMTEAEVRAVIRKDFGLAESAIQIAENPAERTKALVIQIPELAPAPTPAMVSYIFGATSRRLMHVNVVWADAAPTAERRREFAAAGLQLSEYFRTLPVQPRLAGPGGALSDRAVLMFVATDAQGAALEVAAEGIEFQVLARDGKSTNSSAPSGPVALRVSYIANALTPDVSVLKPGSF
jgi:hypothetical protein